LIFSEIRNRKVYLSILRYTGHVHQLRFRQGHTYGEETHRVAQDFPHLLKRSKTDIPIVKYDQSDPYETHDFPDGMLPGYSGEELILSFYVTIYFIHQVTFLNVNFNMVIDIESKQMHVHQIQKIAMNKENKKLEIYNVLLVLIQKPKV
jgi:hypothetical protein